jgi:hypothetical protein
VPLAPEWHSLFFAPWGLALKRYEQSVRVVTALFATLLGFGLKQILDNFPDKSTQVPCFLMALMLFLRFLLGSANQSWSDYVKPDAGEVPEKVITRGPMVTDFVFLLIFGLLGSMICYSTSFRAFMERMLVFNLVAVAWCLIYIRRDPRRSVFDDWVKMDVAHALVSGAGVAAICWFPLASYRLTWFQRFGSPPPHVGALLLMLINFGLFLWDVHFQLGLLAALKPAPKANSGPSIAPEQIIENSP